MSVYSRSQDGDDTKAEPVVAQRQTGGCDAGPRCQSAPQVAHRVLFLDDDPKRAVCFLAQVPAAVWVKSVAECLPRMLESWEEIHLDHDLEGETLVDMNRVDSGMEIIRWLCKEPRPHLRQTRFFVHTHNVVAGLMMVLQMRESGYQAELRPFGRDLALALQNPQAGDSRPSPAGAGPLGGWRRWVRWAAALGWPWRKERL
jgi:hypothetical protein